MKNKHDIKDCGKARAYTLVELLVAVAILVIMMGFLFEFVIGAQRIWSASEKKATSFDTAQVAMDVIETDLHNMQFSNEPGRTMPFYLWKKSANEIVLGFFADYKSSNFGKGDTADEKAFTYVGTYPVIYYYYKDGTNPGALYRIALDGKVHFNIANNNGIEKEVTLANLWYLYGAEYARNNDFFGTFITKAFGGATTEANLKEFDVLAENIESFDVDALLDNNTDQGNFNPEAAAAACSKRYAASRPKVVKLQMKIDSNHDENKGGMETTNSFTKVIFL